MQITNSILARKRIAANDIKRENQRNGEGSRND